MSTLTSRRFFRCPWAARLAARRGDHDVEGGYVMVMLTLMFTLLLLFAGYSVDAGNWNLHRNETRTAAEAAALGGVAFLPDDFSAAQATALQIAQHHGYDPSEVSIALGSGDNQLEVTISDEVSNYFVRVIGMDTTTIVSKATAEFEQPVEMGSPDHILGNDPETGYAPDYWLSIASRYVGKDLGDRFNTRFCSWGTANCSGPWNLEYDSSGYKYAVRVTDTSQPLRIQIFDPAWVWTGSTCAVPNWPTTAEIAALQTYDDGSYSKIPVGYYDDAATRYAPGDTDWCVGDDRPGWAGPATSYTVRMPDDSPWDDNNNQALNLKDCKPQTFPAYTPTSIYAPPTQSIAELLDPTVGSDDEWEIKDDKDFTFAEVFRRWVTICEIPAGSPWLVEGDYIIQVRTTDYTAGQNRFSLRAGPPDGSGGVLDVGQSTFSRGRFPIYANTGSADIQFYLARVPPSSGERTLEVTFFDIGDASAPGSLSVVPPPGSLASGVFTDCDFTLGGSSVASTNCAVSNVLDTNGYGEQIVEATVTIPSQNDPLEPYWCDVNDPNDCWVTVRAQFAGGLTDATTWTANLVGDAVRIIDDD